MKPEESILFGQIAINKGLVSPQQLHECLQYQGQLAQVGTKRLIGELLRDRGAIAEAQISVILTAQKKLLAQAQDGLFGEAAIADGYATPNQVKECLVLQDNIRKTRPGSVPPLADIMVTKGYITPQQRGLIERGTTSRRPEQVVPQGAPPGGDSDIAHIPGLHARHAFEGQNCLFCKMVISADQAVQVCEGCSGLYHAECWAETGGCANTKCEMSADKAIASAGQVRWTREQLIRYYGVRAGVAAAIVIAIIAAVIFTRKTAEDYYKEAKAIEDELSGAQSRDERAWSIFDHRRAELIQEESSGKVIGGAERRRKREKQLDALKKTVEKDPTFIDAWFDMGVIYSEFKKPKEAYDAYKKVVELNPKHEMAHVMLGLILEEDKDYASAETEYKAGIAAADRVGPAHRALGILYDDKFDNTREKDAEEVYRRFIASRSDADILGRLGLIVAGQGKGSLEEALVFFEKALQLDPKLASARYGRALVAFNQGKISEASALIADLATNSRNAEHIRLYGLCLAREKRPDEAIDVLRQAVGLFPRDMELHLALSDVYVSVGRPGDAARTLQTISNVFPRDTKLLFSRGMLSLAVGNNEEAKTLFERLKDADPNYPDVWYYLAKASISKQDWNPFKACLEEAAKRAPTDMRIPLLHSEFKRARGSYAEARAVCKETLAKDPGFGPAYYELGLIARAQRNIPEAIEKFQLAVAKGGSEGVYFDLGMLYYELAKYDKAGEYLQLYLDKASLAPQGQAARERLAWIDNHKSYVPQQIPDVSDKITEWAESVQGGSCPELYQTLTITASAVGYLAACIKGEKEKEAGLGGKLQNSILISEQYVIPDDPSATSLRTQYFDFMAQSYVAPNGVEAAEILRGIAAGSTPKSPQGVAAQKVIEELKKVLTRSAMPQVQRVQAVTGAWVKLFHIILQKHTNISSNVSRLEAIKAQHAVQEKLSANALQKICNDIYACADLGSLAVAISDGATNDQRDKVVQWWVELNRSDRDAETCIQQINFGAVALIRILSLIASDSTVAAEASMRFPK